ncbi:hypothetical protein YC2023_049557 [Brassica napus]
MLLHHEVWGSNPKKRKLCRLWRKKLQEVFNIVLGVSSNMDLIGRLGVTQSDVHSHMMVELSAESKARLVDIYSCRLNFGCPEHLQLKPIIPISLHHESVISKSSQRVISKLSRPRVISKLSRPRVINESSRLQVINESLASHYTIPNILVWLGNTISSHYNVSINTCRYHSSFDIHKKLPKSTMSKERHRPRKHTDNVRSWHVSIEHIDSRSYIGIDNSIKKQINLNKNKIISID